MYWGGHVIICLLRSITVLNSRVFTSYETFREGKQQLDYEEDKDRKALRVFVNSGWQAHPPAWLLYLAVFTT